MVLPSVDWVFPHQSLSGKAQNNSTLEGSQGKAQRVGLGPAASLEEGYGSFLTVYGCSAAFRTLAKGAGGSLGTFSEQRLERISRFNCFLKE